MTGKIAHRPGGEHSRLRDPARGDVLIDIRYGEGVTKLSDLDDVTASGEIAVVVLRSIERVPEQLRKPCAKLKRGDALIVYVANDELYAAAVSALQLRA
jgi:hypothetical protein